MNTPELTITYRQAVHAGACQESRNRMCDSDIIGGDWGTFGRDTPIPLTAVLDVLGLDDLLWALHATDRSLCQLVASDFAAHVHWVWAEWAPDDDRVSASIRATRRAARAPGAARAAEYAGATRAAEYAGAAGAAGAAWAALAALAAEASRAAWAAEDARSEYLCGAGEERAWQIDHVRAVLSGGREPGHVPVTPRKGDAGNATRNTSSPCARDSGR